MPSLPSRSVECSLTRKSEAFARNFASQWLHLRNLREWTPDPRHYPNADKSLMKAMERETELFFMSIVREDRNIADLLTADYTFVNGRLAHALQYSRRRRESVSPCDAQRPEPPGACWVTAAYSL